MGGWFIWGISIIIVILTIIALVLEYYKIEAKKIWALIERLHIFDLIIPMFILILFLVFSVFYVIIY
jgi:hypothetical protein